MKKIYPLLFIFILSQCSTTHTSTYSINGENYNCYSRIKRAIKIKEDIKCFDFSQEKRFIFDNRILEFENLKKLDISNMNLKEIPAVIFQIQSLEILIAKNNEISDISPAIGNLINLKELYISNNPISEFPPVLKKLNKLKVIRITNIGFSEKEIVNMKKNIPDGCNLFLDEIMIDYFPQYYNDSIINRNRNNNGPSMKSGHPR